METQTLSPTVQEIITSLESTSDVNPALARLLEKQLDRELTIYEQMDASYQKQYGMSFDEFYRSPLMQQPSFNVEQDYFDWEMATTLIKGNRSGGKTKRSSKSAQSNRLRYEGANCACNANC